MRRTIAITALLVLPLGALAACGGDDDDASGGNDTETTDGGTPVEGGVTVVAENVEFTEDSYSAAAGEVSLNYENEDSVRHTLLIDGVDEDDFFLETAGGESASGSVELEPGDYDLFCDVAGHGSMRATLTVE